MNIRSSIPKLPYLIAVAAVLLITGCGGGSSTSAAVDVTPTSALTVTSQISVVDAK